MTLYPAIDLMGGCVVRLRQGKASEKTVYSQHPAEVATRWAQAGAPWLHVVDLDGAFQGQSANLSSVAEICKASGIPVQLGGGIRDEAAAEKAFAAGVSRVILGSKACTDPAWIAHMTALFGGDRIAVGIDARDGMVAVKGWTEISQRPASEVALAALEGGASRIIYTDIATDGMLTGPNFDAVEKMVQMAPDKVIASGGVSCLQDVIRLRAIPRLHGTILGKALYDNKLDLIQALQIASQPPTPPSL